jgi:PHD/YefM family antitoxin component YafN of YafNO toxin-antitoxin module
MKVLTASQARASLYRLIDKASQDHETTLIKGKRNNAILISEDDWRSIEETLYLLSIPSMRESIREGLTTPLSQTSKVLDW